MSNSGISRRDFLWRSSLATFSSIFLLDKASALTPDLITAETSFGKVRGLDHRNIKVFKGIPYGGNTSGANRFMPPVDPPKWTGIRDAFEYGHSAPQSLPNPAPVISTGNKPSPPSSSGPSIFKALGVSGETKTGEGEDCLLLNVWTPAINDGRKRPVMLWLHGGGFRGGSGSNPGWDGTNLCLRGDVVVITINHRLNVFGFANFSELNADFTGSGQAGMLDIVHALKWVRTNIEQFGGDPNCVMIFGQSGGGRKCETLLAMPSAKGLFHRAAIESGIAMKIVDRDIATRNARLLLDKLGISLNDIHKIQNMPLNQILAAHFALNHDLGDNNLDTIGFAPSLDDALLPNHPFYPNASAISAEVPVLIGNTRTESTGLTSDISLFYLDEDNMHKKVKELLKDGSEDMINLYRKFNHNATPSELYFLIASDFSYGAKTMKIAEQRADLGKGDVFLYYFAWESPVQDGLLKSPHNIEWPFAFDNVEICSKLTGGGPDAMALADKVSDAWIAFARTGNPNTPKLPHWPVYNKKDRATMILNNKNFIELDPFKEQRIAMFKALNL